jgi:ABC-type multidrug transport system fused ATPase/permease subunit
LPWPQIVAFINGWRMTLVVTACVPVLATTAWLQTSIMLAAFMGCARLQLQPFLHLKLYASIRSSASPMSWLDLPACIARPLALCSAGNAPIIPAPYTSWTTHCFRESESFALANQTATEAFTNIRTIAAFGMESKVAELYGEKLGAPTRMSRKRAISSGERLGIREGNARLCGWHFSRAGAALRTTDASCLAGAGFGANQFVVFGTFSLAFWYAGLEVSAHYPCWYACSQRL